MDTDIYPEATIQKYLDENLLFKDAKLKKYYERNEQRDLGKLLLIKIKILRRLYT